MTRDICQSLSVARPASNGAALRRAGALACAAAGVAFVFTLPAAQAQTLLADQPVFTNNGVPGNLAMPLSVEFPTAVTRAHLVAYTTAQRFLGYFDPAKCYSYRHFAVENAALGQLSHFYPNGAATATFSCAAAPGRWSGNFLNWATTQTIDPFRSALTGGNRVIDTPTTTVIEKALASGQGGVTNFPNLSINAAVGNSTPFTWAAFNMRIQGLGTRMRFTRTGNLNNVPTQYDPALAVISDATTYDVAVRVQVCVPNAPGFAAGAGVEANCRQYGANYKPEGLIQQYSERIRYSAFGYLNDSNLQRDGGVLRARQKFVGPQEPRPGLPNVPNLRREWDAATGVFLANPDAADAATTTSQFALPTAVTNSGVINYLNKFGSGSAANGSYKSFDPVGELYYAAVRYFKNIGNVPAWTNMGGATIADRQRWVDGFPVITDWDDPIQYSCQRNYILGIGDTNTHADKNVPGATRTESEPAKPAEVLADASADAAVDTNRVGAMEGLGNLGTNAYPFCCSNNGALMAGLAYDIHTRDMRPDLPNAPQSVGQTVSTYWLDVLESGYRSRNQFWLAAKYGGFRVPTGFNPNTATGALPTASWNANGDTVGADLRPDNYYIASRPDTMVAGLTAAFASIASDLRASTTSFSAALPQVSNAGSASFSAQYNAADWTGELEASVVSFPAPNYSPVVTSQWRASDRLGAQLAGTGWNLGRRVISYNGTNGVAFRASGGSSISAAQLATLDTSYVTADDRTQYLNYLRGDRSNEQGATGTPLGYRVRTTLLGDIVNSRVTVVGPPSSPYSDSFNPGYTAFRAANAGRPTMVFVGANDGMLHAFYGDLGATGGREVFAYVPSALYSGPNNTPNANGLAALGNPAFVHHNYVDATPEVFDIDTARTGGPIVGNPTPNWRSVLIGGLGKGGRSYYAIDVTNLSAEVAATPSLANEAALATRVLWEFPNNTLPVADRAFFGFSYGEPKVTKTAKYGWVVIFTSGYNNSDGGGHLFFVNAATGAFLERVSTNTGTVAAPAGLAHVQAYTRNFTDNTTESLYAGDLLGNLWRVDVQQATGVYQAAGNPRLIARALDINGAVQPITSRVRVAIHPRTGRRHVLFGTGRLLDVSDLGSPQPQTFYAILDGTLPTFNTDATLPVGVTFPITRANLVNNTASLLTGFTPDPTRPMGWFVELGTNATGIAWRNTLESDVFFGEVAFASVVPGSDACSPGGNTRAYSVDFSNGRTTLIQRVPNPMGPPTIVPVAYSEAIAGIVTDLRYVNREGTSELIGGGSAGSISNLPRNPPTADDLRRLNWRELPAPQ